MSSLSLSEPQLERLEDMIQEIDITEGLDAAFLLETPALIDLDLAKRIKQSGIDRRKIRRNERSFFIAEIRRRAALAAIGVERYLREHGRLPDRLNDLVPDFLDAVPLNPAFGTPLEFAVRDDRYFIFGSVESHPVPNPIERNDSGYWALRVQGPHRPIGFTVRFAGRDE